LIFKTLLVHLNCTNPDSMSKNNGNNSGLLALLLIVGAVALITLFIRTPIFLIFSVFMFALLIGLIFYMIHKGIDFKKHQAMKNTVEGRINQYQQECDKQIGRHQAELEEIQKNIKEIETKLMNASELKEETKRESQRIIDGFKTELKLRNTKLNFYTTCKRKLRAILDNHKLAEDLVKKQEKLNELQERNYDDLAAMESLKTEVVLDSFYVDSIEELSLKMLDINSLESAEALQLELIEITKSLKEL